MNKITGRGVILSSNVVVPQQFANANAIRMDYIRKGLISNVGVTPTPKEYAFHVRMGIIGRHVLHPNFKNML